MDYIVRTAMAIEREIDDARSIKDMGAGDKRKEGQPSSSSGKSRRLLVHKGFKDKTTAIRANVYFGDLGACLRHYIVD